MKKRHKLAIAAVAVGMGFAGVSDKPATAADFNFTFKNLLSFAVNGGSLSFNQSPLTGTGLETVALSDLPDAVFSFKYTNNLPISFSPPVSFSLSNPSFTFANGNLIGISGDSSVPVYDGDGRYFPFVVIFQGNDRLSLMGAQYEEDLSGVLTYIDGHTGIVTSTRNLELGLNQGNISFNTIEPVTPAKPVPEPLTCAGTVVAGGVGLLMKRKQARSQTKA